MKELLRMVAHMRWADALIAGALVAEPRIDGEALRLFAHVAAAEHLWLARIHGRPAEVAVWPSLSADAAGDLAARSAGELDALVRAGDDAALARVIEYRNSAGRDFSNTVGDIVTHVTLHGSHHRGQILHALRAAGREPPYVDFIQFARRDQ
jgi:uncharacterized damage-inducible protein DinB